MKFKLSTSGWRYTKEGSLKLKKLGFTFNRLPEYRGLNFIDNNDVKIELNTLEELMEFIKTYGGIVVTEDSIEIYDEHRE